jgi:hypothetical protein
MVDMSDNQGLPTVQAPQNSNQNELFTWVVKAGATRIYYINVKEDKNGDLYLVLKETKRRDDESKEVHRVMVFQKDFGKFVDGMRKALEFINNHNQGEEDLSTENKEDSPMVSADEESSSYNS